MKQQLKNQQTVTKQVTNDILRGVTSIEQLIQIKGLKTLSSATDGHLILRKKDLDVIRFCVVNKILWWLDASDNTYMHVDYKIGGN